ncbi:flagellar biosynthesis protein FlhA [Buchnera aphidicola]|uniref:Flagellar biosynthesis protein FlhA n=1 Tax=Buchnera aphidicola str. USDA (Myzus persicae) TaxID=1009856 RepID=W0P073_BUCMP|nr:flagellar biosynthesis protein FlhA [Buchnera aphidicola]AHG60134.1 Flha [Buchnera aphidicola str. USDA (Myzus persicae)]AHG60714.1 Flha [Buchnera aphidicola str. W106 (Myzus persicae)]AHG61286.1 Flha [Buchnera aphidicola str. G002 (Myzus persicae)]AHG61859.1 Flha [Buchnera aphidicola str. F009 (Myzus persicae)]WAI03177.1 MAG: flagellar biosynthesis protein FlhA [Buchnera aphidicola (Myzus persicae)]
MINFSSFFRIIKIFKTTQWQILAGPILILMILSMMVLPLAPFVLDVFFTFNIALSIIILLVSMFTRHTLEFTAFPTILLFSTLLRLALNVASTRVIFLNGHIGTNAAGKVIESFGHFLVGGNFAIGIVVFIILVIINFIVITKGASRIAEVGARFILDAMPGKQMAIDADLNAGLIGEEKAKKRRAKITQEADFYGSMDGASKFVRGDAIAGILIMILNIFGGLIIGLIQHQMPLNKAAEVYTLLTIGDGLVAQIPALVISTAAGVIVTRVSTNQNVGEQMVSQLFYNPQVILLSAIVLGVLGLVPGMPNIIFLFFTVLLFILSWWLYEKKYLLDNDFSNKEYQLIQDSILEEASWNDISLEDPIKIEIGYNLTPMIDINKKDNLLNKIKMIRKKIAQEIGFLPPLIHIKNNINLSENTYRILIKGVEIGKGKCLYDCFLAINSGRETESLPFDKVYEPTFGLSGYWINKEFKNEAQKKGYSVVESSTVISTHLNFVISSNIHELFGRQEAQQLIEYIARDMPKLTEDLIPNIITLTVFHKILRNLLLEHVPIRDMRTILETLSEYAGIQKDPDELTAIVRIALSKIITQKLFYKKNIIEVIGLESNLEQLLLNSLKNNTNTIEPILSETLLIKTKEAIQNQLLIGSPLVLLVSHRLRHFLSQFLRQSFPELTVLSQFEITDMKKIKMTSIIGN